jgi:hypothetical protein
MKDELITRLQNACAQRDEARAQVRPGYAWLPLRSALTPVQLLL